MILLLTGPPASGKTTIGNCLGQLVPNVAVIDVDLLRAMVRNPHIPPWQGERGNQQLLLGARNACELANRFNHDGLNVVILDVLTNESAAMYRQALGELGLEIVLLMPTLAVCLTRNQDRGQWLTDSEVETLYRWEAALTEFDRKIDNSTLTAEEVVSQLISVS